MSTSPAGRSQPVIGVDFDNTLIIYDDLLRKLAVDRNLLGRPRPARFRASGRSAMRSARSPAEKSSGKNCRPTPTVPRIGEARLAIGAARFLELARAAGITVYTISHKTEWASQDRTGTNLRRAALDWMEANGLFADCGAGLSPRQGLFRGHAGGENRPYSRAAAARISSTTWKRPSRKRPFLPASTRILYAPHPAGNRPPGVMVAAILEADL